MSTHRSLGWKNSRRIPLNTVRNWPNHFQEKSTNVCLYLYTSEYACGKVADIKLMCLPIAWTPVHTVRNWEIHQEISIICIQSCNYSILLNFTSVTSNMCLQKGFRWTNKRRIASHIDILQICNRFKFHVSKKLQSLIQLPLMLHSANKMQQQVN